MSSEEKETNIFDSLTSKKEVALTLSGVVIGGLTAITLADYGSVVVGLTESTRLPTEVSAFTITVGTTLLGYILGKKDKE